MDTESSSNFFHTAIKNSFPYATNIRTPDDCSAVKPVFVVETRKRGPIICKFVDSSIAARDRSVSERLTQKGIPIPKISINGYFAQWYEVYDFNPNRTLAQHIKSHIDDDRIFETYKQALDIQAKLAECSLDDAYSYSSVGKYFSDVYKITAPVARPKFLTNIYSAMIKILSQWHNIHLVHCDLKPANIICKDDGSLDQIIDVTGIALASEEFAMISILESFPLPDLSEELMDYYDSITHRKLDRNFIRTGLKLIKKKQAFISSIRNCRKNLRSKTK